MINPANNPANLVHILLAIDNPTKRKKFFDYIDQVIKTIPELDGVHIHQLSMDDTKTEVQSCSKNIPSFGAFMGFLNRSPEKNETPSLINNLGINIPGITGTPPHHIKILTIFEDTRKPKEVDALDMSEAEMEFQNIYGTTSTRRAIFGRKTNLDRTFLHVTDHENLPPSKIPHDLCTDFEATKTYNPDDEKNNSEYMHYPELNSLPRINFSNPEQAIKDLRYFFRKLVGDFGLFEDTGFNSFTEKEQQQLEQALENKGLSSVIKDLFTKFLSGMTIGRIGSHFPKIHSKKPYSIILDYLYNPANFEKVKNITSLQQYTNVLTDNLTRQVKEFLAGYFKPIDFNVNGVRKLIYDATGILVPSAIRELMIGLQKTIADHNANLAENKMKHLRAVHPVASNYTKNGVHAKTEIKVPEFLPKSLFDHAFTLRDGRSNMDPKNVITLALLEPLQSYLNISAEEKTDFEQRGFREEINDSDIALLQSIIEDKNFTGARLTNTGRLRILMTIFSLDENQWRQKELYKFVRDHKNFNTIISRIAVNQPAK